MFRDSKEGRPGPGITSSKAAVVVGAATADFKAPKAKRKIEREANEGIVELAGSIVDLS